MALLSLCIIAVLTLGLCFYLYRKLFAFKEFTQEGITGPEPHWLLGNAKAFLDPFSRHLVVPNWSRQYGKIFGYYEGSRPTLVSCDPTFVQQVFIKQFPNFHGRKLLPIQPNPDTTTEPLNMLLARGDRWKRLRTIVNPTFSAAKLRNLMPLMTKCQNDFMALIDREASKEHVDIFECYKKLTLDTISETAFGVELNCTKTEGTNPNPMLQAINELFRSIADAPLPMKISMVLPELSLMLRRFEFWRANVFKTGMIRPRNMIYEMIEKIVESRKANTPSNQQRNDVLQMMLELEESASNNTALLSGHKGLSLDEIKGQSVLFMIAGFETSSNTLSFASFLLANNPVVQEKLLQEIDSYFGDPLKQPDYDNVADLTYMDCVINEALRLYPVAPLILNRLTMDDTEINGIRLLKGLPILADVWSLHRDEEQWGPVDTEKFHPERFLADYPTTAGRNDAAFMPFGLGPRICIGMRFAMLEMKLTLVNLLRKYRLVKTSKTGDVLRLRSAFTITPAGGIVVRLERRD